MAKILNVNDNGENRYLMRVLFEAHGHVVVDASNGAEALRTAEENTPDLVISDILMPEMDGFSLCRAWMKDERLHRIPFVMYSATYTDSNDEKLAYDLGSAAFLVKPVEPDELLARVTDLLRSTKDAAGPFASAAEESDRLKLYSERLVNRLEQKMLQLEQVNSELARKEAALAHTEEQLRAAQRMESLGRLAAGVAHDFNNLLFVIINYSDLISQGIDASSPLAADMDAIHQAGERAKGLTRQLLAFSRRQVLNLDVIDPNALIREINSLLARLLGRDVEIALDLSDALGHIEADAGHITQVIMNLAVNARDAMPNGGRLTIQTADKEFGDDDADMDDQVAPGRYVALSVSDTGVGMDAETRGHAFEPFFTTKETGRGTGLGLSTVYGIVKQCAGHIRLTSEPGQGTCVTILFPRVEPRPPTQTGARVEGVAAPGGGETILVVDADDAVRGLEVRLLRNAGYNVLSAANGDLAMQLVESVGGEIHMLLSDVVMPRTSGPELAVRLRERHPGLRVLFTAAYDTTVLGKAGDLTPVVSFIAKPFSGEVFAGKVREALDSARLGR